MMAFAAPEREFFEPLVIAGTAAAHLRRRWAARGVSGPACNRYIARNAVKPNALLKQDEAA